MKVAISTPIKLQNNNSPMLEVPRSAENKSEPKAVAVVRAENKTARAVGEARKFVIPARQFMTK